MKDSNYNHGKYKISQPKFQISRTRLQFISEIQHEPDEVIYSNLSKIQNSKIKIENDSKGNKRIEICLFMGFHNERSIQFLIVYHSNKDYFDYKPIKLDFPIQIMPEFGQELEIYKEDLNLVINTFIDIRDKFNDY